MEIAAYLTNRCDIGSDGKTPMQRLHGRKDHRPILVTLDVMPRNMFPEISTEETERSKNGKGFKGPGRSPSRTMGSRSCPSELLRDVCARAHGRSQT